MQPQQSGQSLHSNQRCGQEQHHAVQVVEKEQEAESNDITEEGELSHPGLKDALETQKSCVRNEMQFYSVLDH